MAGVSMNRPALSLTSSRQFDRDRVARRPIDTIHGGEDFGEDVANVRPNSRRPTLGNRGAKRSSPIHYVTRTDG